jgi:SAM-dependent methyltransferase
MIKTRWDTGADRSHSHGLAGARPGRPDPVAVAADGTRYGRLTGAPTARYWDAVAAEWQEEAPQRAWRAHCDVLSCELLRCGLPQRRVTRALKTDLFDEAVSRGVVSPLADAVDSLHGVDISRRIATMARARYPDLGAVTADVRALPYADDAFDLVISLSTLDHFLTSHEVLVALRELYRVLRPEGLLLITLDNPVNPVVALRNALPADLLNRLGLVPYFVGATLGPRGLRRALENIGFEVRELSAFLHCPRLPAVVLSGLFARHASTAGGQRFERTMGRFERLARWPTRFITGYYVVAWASKPRVACSQPTRTHAAPAESV